MAILHFAVGVSRCCTFARIHPLFLEDQCLKCWYRVARSKVGPEVVAASNHVLPAADGPQRACMQVNAIATFNILAQEGRHVAGAFVPMEAPERG